MWLGGEREAGLTAWACTDPFQRSCVWWVEVCDETPGFPHASLQTHWEAGVPTSSGVMMEGHRSVRSWEYCPLVDTA